jgi:DNA gyrase subunit A
LGRGTAGVRLFNVDENEHVVGAAKIDESDEEDADASIESGVEGDGAVTDTPIAE